MYVGSLLEFPFIRGGGRERWRLVRAIRPGTEEKREARVESRPEGNREECGGFAVVGGMCTVAGRKIGMGWAGEGLEERGVDGYGQGGWRMVGDMLGRREGRAEGGGRCGRRREEGGRGRGSREVRETEGGGRDGPREQGGAGDGGRREVRETEGGGRDGPREQGGAGDGGRREVRETEGGGRDGPREQGGAGDGGRREGRAEGAGRCG